MHICFVLIWLPTVIYNKKCIGGTETGCTTGSEKDKLQVDLWINVSAHTL